MPPSATSRRTSALPQSFHPSFLELAEHSPNMIFINYQGRVVYANRACEKTMGYTREEFCAPGFDFRILIAPEALPTVETRFAAHRQGKEVDACEYRLLTRTGQSIHAVISTKLIEYNGGQAILGIITDITPYKHLQKQVEQERDRVQTYLNVTSVMLVVLDVRGRVSLINQKGCEILGYTEKEILGKDWFASFLPPDGRKATRAVFNEIVAGKDTFPPFFENPVLNKAGERIDIAWHNMCLKDEHGAITGTLSSGVDISSQKKAEKELNRRIEFERLVTLIASRFVYVHIDEFDREINDTLKKLGDFMAADRTYLFQVSEDRHTITNTHEWTARGISSEMKHLVAIPVETFPWLLPKLLNQEVVNIPDVDALPPDASAEKREFKAEKIRSILLVPTVSRDSVTGFLGFDAVTRPRTWSDDAVSILQIVSGIITSAMGRRNAYRELHDRLKFEEMITSVSAKFVNIAPAAIDDTITSSLAVLGTFAGVDRAYIYQCSPDDAVFRRSHSWMAPGLSKSLPDTEEFACTRYPGLVEHLRAGRVLHIPDAHLLPPDDQTPGGQYVRKHNLRSLLAVPLFAGNTLCFLGFSSEMMDQDWPEDVVSLFKIVGEIFAGALERKTAADDLEKERRLIASLMDTLPDSIYFKDLQSRFIRINKALARHLGLSHPDQAVGKTDHDFFSKEHADAKLAAEQEIIRTGRPLMDLEEKSELQGRSGVWVSTTKVPLVDEKGKIVGTFGVSRDISQRKRDEEERAKIEGRMQHAQKLESLGILSGGIAHDFNNLLMGILGNTGLALMELPPESPARQSVKQIETVALRAAELTNQMLAYSGKSTSVIKPLNLTALVKEMAHLLEVSISRKATLVYDFDDKAFLVDGDATQLRQIVMNLITNASDALEDRRGTITVRTRNRTVDGAFLSSCYIGSDLPPGTYVCVEVADTGCGMDAATVTKIFDPFFTTKVSGRGLGLAAVLGIVRAHKGALRVESEVGRGTTFHVLFSRSSQQPSSGEEAASGDEPWRGSGGVLVVDDDETVLKVTEQILKRLGFEAVTASDEQTALKVLRKPSRRIVAILMDVTMPETSLETMLTGVRGVAPTVPVILISGYSEASATVGIEPGSYQGFLQKPFNADALRQKLRDILDA